MGSLHFRRWRPAASAHARLHLGVLLAALALTLTWGAALDPAETVAGLHGALDGAALQIRSEEHTSELQSQSNLVCRLLLEKKKKTKQDKSGAPVQWSASPQIVRVR